MAQAARAGAQYDGDVLVLDDSNFITAINALHGSTVLLMFYSHA